MPLETLTALIELANAARKLFSEPENKIDHSLADKLTKALRAIYFPPDGILSFLLEIQKGERPNESRMQDALTAFNDRQWQVTAALDSLQFRRLAKKLGLSLATIVALDKARDQKTGLRHDIQNEINYYGQRGVQPVKQKVRELVCAIRKLNSTIEQVEELVNSRAKSRL